MSDDQNKQEIKLTDPKIEEAKSEDNEEYKPEAQIFKENQDFQINTTV